MRIFGIATIFIFMLCLPGKAETYLLVGDSFPLLCERFPDGTVRGLAVDIASIIGKRLGHTFRVELYPWKRAQRMVANGAADILMPPYRTPEREKWLDFSAEPFNIDQGFFYTLSENAFSWEGDYARLRGKRIGVVLGWSYGRAFEKARNSLLLDAAAGIDNTFRKLTAGRVDLVPSNEREALASIQRLGIQGKVKELAPPISREGNHFGFSRKKKLDDLREQFERFLHEMTENGELSGLRKKYRLHIE